MPARIISAASGGIRKVSGNSIAMVATGPMPGSTPISVPSSAPMRQKPRLESVSACSNPSARLPRKSMSPGPQCDGLAEPLHEHQRREHREPERQKHDLDLAHVGRRKSSD